MEKPDFPQWIETENGKKCLDMSTLTEEKYLQNRLFWAFDAGRDRVWEQYLSYKKENLQLRETLQEFYDLGERVWGKAVIGKPIRIKDRELLSGKK